MCQELNTLNEKRVNNLKTLSESELFEPHTHGGNIKSLGLDNGKQ